MLGTRPYQCLQEIPYKGKADRSVFEGQLGEAVISFWIKRTHTVHKRLVSPASYLARDVGTESPVRKVEYQLSFHSHSTRGQLVLVFFPWTSIAVQQVQDVFWTLSGLMHGSVLQEARGGVVALLKIGSFVFQLPDVSVQLPFPRQSHHQIRQMTTRRERCHYLKSRLQRQTHW